MPSENPHAHFPGTTCCRLARVSRTPHAGVTGQRTGPVTSARIESRACRSPAKRPSTTSAPPPTAPRPLPPPRPDRPGLRGGCRPPPPPPRGRGHLHHRSQHQLHQLLHRVLHLDRKEHTSELQSLRHL